MIKQPPQDPPFGNQLRNYMAWVWPTELAWGELAVVHPSAVFSGQPIMESHTVTHHPVSESPPRAESEFVFGRLPQPFSPLVFASVQSGGDSMAPSKKKKRQRSGLIDDDVE